MAARKDRRQVKLGQLFAEAAKRGIDQEELRNTIAPAQLGKRLSKANEVEIERLSRYITGGVRSQEPGVRPLMSGYKERFEDLGHRDGMATPGQLRKIEAMWMEVSRMPNHAAREKALQGFLKRIVGVEDLRFVANWMVQKIIKAVESMKRKTARPSPGPSPQTGRGAGGQG